jgi:5-methyltetrahydrofolate--homocysteine methyltransferase
MNRDEFRKRVSSGTLLLDGAMGSELLKAGLPQGHIPEEWLVTRAGEIARVSSGYASSGSDAVYTCTFGANRLTLAKHGLGDKVAEVNRLGAATARQAAPGKLVFGSVGPTGEMLESSGGDFLTDKDAQSAFAEQISALIAGGVDAIVSETNIDLNEAVLAVKAARDSGDIAVLASMTFQGADKGYRTFMGNTPEQVAEQLLAAGADAVGVNCGFGGPDALAVAKRMKAAHPGAVIMAKPNAGLPTPSGVYPTGPEEFAGEGLALRDAGVRILGGCCGTSPAHLGALAKALRR